MTGSNNINTPASSSCIVRCTMNGRPRSKEEENQQAEERRSGTALSKWKCWGWCLSSRTDYALILLSNTHWSSFIQLNRGKRRRKNQAGLTWKKADDSCSIPKSLVTIKVWRISKSSINCKNMKQITFL